MCTAEPNDILWLPEATVMNTNDCDMLDDSNFLFFGAIEAVVGPHGGNMKNRRCFSYRVLEIKITVFACLLSDEGCDSFPKHLDLALTPNKTNEGVKKQ